jgi:hypothetical protein
MENLNQWRVDYDLPMTDGDGGITHKLGLHPMTAFCTTEAEAWHYSPPNAVNVRVTRVH